MKTGYVQVDKRGCFLGASLCTDPGCKHEPVRYVGLFWNANDELFGEVDPWPTEEPVKTRTAAITEFIAAPRTGNSRRIWALESALERIANSKHGDRHWMAGVAREALQEAARIAAEGDD